MAALRPGITALEALARRTPALPVFDPKGGFTVNGQKAYPVQVTEPRDGGWLVLGTEPLPKDRQPVVPEGQYRVALLRAPTKTERKGDDRGNLHAVEVLDAEAPNCFRTTGAVELYASI